MPTMQAPCEGLVMTGKGPGHESQTKATRSNLRRLRLGKATSRPSKTTSPPGSEPGGLGLGLEPVSQMEDHTQPRDRQ